MLAAIWLVAAVQAGATPEFAKQWESSCSSCHEGAPTSLDEEGIAFKLAGYEMEMVAAHPRPKLFFSFLTDVASFTRTDDTSEEMEGPEEAQLFSLLRIDEAGKVKVFVIGDLRDDEDEGLDLEFAHGHFQVNPLREREKLSLRIGNVEPITRLWNTDMRRPFLTSLWGGVDTALGEVEDSAGGHAHAHGGDSGRPGVLPASDWGADVSSVIGRHWLVAGGAIDETAFGGVFWKRGGRGFDNSTYPRDLDYAALGEEEKSAFNASQTRMAKKWERSVIVGVSAYTGSGLRDVFDGSFLEPSPLADEHDDEHGDEHSDEGEGEHDDEHDEGEGEHGDEHDEGEGEHGDEHDEGGEEHGDDHSEAILPTRIAGTSRLAGEMKARWNRWGFYLVGVYGVNDYDVGDPDAWQDGGVFRRDFAESESFAAWALETSARFAISRRLTGRAALRYESLSPESDAGRSFERLVANLTLPLRMMRPAVWPYLEASDDLVRDEWVVRGGLRIAY